ncbi:MAG: 5'-deoxynucleotidase [Eubacterium sp.]|nr:5'-deoxynucleotidase [Eubacterium sp.]
MSEQEKESYSFFAMISRMKYIQRWALMRNAESENVSEHSLEAAEIAHALCLIGNKRFGKNLNADRAAVIAIYHDATEILTGDMPTPVKYFNPEIRHAYKDVEATAVRSLTDHLPDDLKACYLDLLSPGEEYAYEKKLVKGADKLSAYIKCLEEKKAGNTEFISAQSSTLASIHEMNLEEVEVFLKEFIPAYEKTLDQVAQL